MLRSGQDRFDRATIDPDQLSFVLCIEGTNIEQQALLLCESIRRFAGQYRRSAIVAVSPRPDVPTMPSSRARLADLGVRHAIAPLNRTGSPYLPINRIVAGAWAEQELATDFIAVLDSDTVFAGEPVFPCSDAGARPVDMKGSCSTGPDDPLDDYWQRISDLAGITIDQLPWLMTTVDNVRVRASYNAGFTVVRRSCGILQKTADIFLASLKAGLKPLRGTGINVHASTGLSGLDASEFWGSSQAALSAAISSQARELVIYDARYNIPLHLLDTTRMPAWPARQAILLHYHWLTERSHRSSLLARLEGFDVSENFSAWMSERLGSLIEQ